jgi:hypothetical protein
LLAIADIRTNPHDVCGTICGNEWRRTMARTIQRLTALSVSKLSKPGLYADGGGLHLRVSVTDSKSWVFRFVLKRRAER